MNYMNNIWMILISSSIGMFSHGAYKEFKHIKHELKKIEKELNHIKTITEK